MFSSTIVSLAILATTCHAHFRLDPFSALDIRVPEENHIVNFTLHNLDAVSEEGKAPRTCILSWNQDTPPACWTTCSTQGNSHLIHARIVSGSYQSVADFSLEIRDADGGTQYAAMAVIKEDVNGYRCSRGAQSDICGYWNSAQKLEVTATETTEGAGPNEVGGVCQ